MIYFKAFHLFRLQCTRGFKLANLICWILLYFVSPIQAQEKPIIADKIIAKVDNYILLQSELEARYEQFLIENPKMKDDGGFKCKLFESLILNKVLLAKAEIDSVEVEDKDIQSQLNRRMEYFIQEAGSPEALETAYGKSLETLKEELKDQVKEQMTIEKMQREITKSIKITPQEVKEFFAKIPDDSIRTVPTEVEIGHIVKVAEVNKSQKQVIKNKLEAIKERIQKGEDFAALAEKYSEDFGSGKRGGALGWHKRGELVPEFEAAIFRMKPNELSKVIESEFGFHLIQLIERRGNEYNSRHILLRAISAKSDLDYAKSFLDSLRTVILADSISFETAAKDHSDDKMSAANGGYLMSPVTGTRKIELPDLDSYIYQLVENYKSLKLGQISEPLPYRTEDGKEAVRIIYYRTRTTPHRMNLIDDYPRIQNMALNQKRTEAVFKWFQKNRSQVFISVDEEYRDCPILKSQ